VTGAGGGGGGALQRLDTQSSRGAQQKLPQQFSHEVRSQWGARPWRVSAEVVVKKVKRRMEHKVMGLVRVMLVPN
jgi:hypothetical protein